MINCPICNKEMKCINNSHLKTHNISMTELRGLFPNVETQTDEVKLKNIENRKLAVKARIIVVKNKTEKRLISKINEFNLLNKKCKECNNLLSYKNEQGEFCNRSCSAQYSNKNRTVIFTKEGKQKQRESGFKNIKNFDEYQKKRPKAQVYNKICVICKNDFQVGSVKKLKKTCSPECRNILHSQVNHRENNTYGKFGYYQGIYCASSWELAFLIDSLDIGKKVERCKLTFTYLMNGEQHTYYPDFIIDDTIYEVKGYEKEDVKLKTEAVMAAGYKIEVIRRKEILPIIKSIKSKYNVKSVIALYDEKLELEVC